MQGGMQGPMLGALGCMPGAMGGMPGGLGGLPGAMPGFPGAAGCGALPGAAGGLMGAGTEEVTYSCEFCRTKFPSYEQAEAHEKLCPMNPQVAAAAVPSQEALAANVMAMMAKGGGMMGKMGPMMGKGSLGMMGGGGAPGKGKAGLPGMGAEAMLAAQGGLGGMLPGMGGGDLSASSSPGGAALAGLMGAPGPNVLGTLGAGMPGKGVLGMMGKSGPGVMSPALLGKGCPGMLGMANPGLLGGIGAGGMLGMAGMGPGNPRPLEPGSAEGPTGAGDVAPGALGTTSTLKEDPAGFEGLCEALKEFRRKWDIELRFEPKIIEHLTKQDRRWKDELDRLDKDLKEAQVPPVCRSGYLLVLFGTVTEANTDEDFRKILCPNLVSEESKGKDAEEGAERGGGGGSSSGRAAAPVSSVELEDEGKMAQIQEFCTRFSIDEPLKNRLIAALKGRLGTFKEDLNTLTSALKAARHPPGLLSLRLREMENGTFQTRGWLPAEESSRPAAERPRSRSRERRRERSRSRERKRDRSKSRERRRRSLSGSRRCDRSDRAEKADRGDRGDRGERPERPERAERSERRDRGDRGEGVDRERDRDRARHAKDSSPSDDAPEEEE